MRLLLVEDDEKVAGFVKKGLEEAGFVVDRAADGRDGLDMALHTPYDVAIVDIMLPQFDGLSLIEQVRRERIPMPVLILSAKRSVDERVEGLQAGGDDYLVKPFAFAELLARVQALLRRAQGLADAEVLRVADLTIDLAARQVNRNGQSIALQAREFALLEYLMRNAGRVVSRTMIMEHVWGYDYYPETNVVDVRVCRLRDKIDKGFAKPLIHTIRGVGYVLKDAD